MINIKEDLLKIEKNLESVEHFPGVYASREEEWILTLKELLIQTISVIKRLTNYINDKDNL